jgi:hypothetical protein
MLMIQFNAMPRQTKARGLSFFFVVGCQVDAL